MSWITTISFSEATGKLKSIYQRVCNKDNNVDNILMAHSLRPHTLEGHMALYKNVLHHSANKIPKHWLEALGVYVSLLNSCDYCVEHHFAGYKKLLNDDQQALSIRQAMQTDELTSVFDAKPRSLFEYAKKLTLSASSVTEEDIRKMRQAGYTDGEILEVNQVVAYFNYANRTVLGLGVNTDNDLLGLSPNDSDDPDNWQHS